MGARRGAERTLSALLRLDPGARKLDEPSKVGRVPCRVQSQSMGARQATEGTPSSVVAGRIRGDTPHGQQRQPLSQGVAESLLARRVRQLSGAYLTQRHGPGLVPCKVNIKI
jgi:hypothetical protein